MNTPVLTQASNILDVMVHPQSVALVGVTVTNPEHWTRTLLEGLLEFGFDRPLYLVNTKGGEIRGMRVYTSLDDVPSPLDYVISTVPAPAAPALVAQCSNKGVKLIQFCTAGFSETGTAQGAEIERQTLEAARRAGIRLVGPNCMGLYCPQTRMSFDAEFPKESGNVGLISQSGGNVNLLVNMSGLRGVRFSKCFSYGNATDINECDLLEYLADDPATEIIAMYVEGVKDGHRFRKAMEKAATTKPVVALKGGVTTGGARAASGHTGSLAGSEATWRSLCLQTGAMAVSTPDDLVDMLVTLRFMRLPSGTGALIIGAGGGASVMITDQFEKNGLRVPQLPVEAIERIREFSQDAGNILRNPIDYSQSWQDIGGLSRMVRIASAASDVNFVVFFMTQVSAPSSYVPRVVGIAKNMAALMRECPKPGAAVVEPSVEPGRQANAFEMMQAFISAGLPVYLSFSSAARAIGAYLDHMRRSGVARAA